MKNKIQKDLNNGMFYKICSNETTFKEYIFPLINEAIAEERERVMGEIEKKRKTIFPLDTKPEMDLKSITHLAEFNKKSMEYNKVLDDILSQR